MNSHINAVTTVKSREIIVARYEAGWAKVKIAASLGISRQTVYKWIRRYHAESCLGLHNRPSKPLRQPLKLAQAREDAIVRLRRLYLMPAYAIANFLHLAYSTVCRYLKKHKLSRVRDIIPPDPVRRYERKTPGEIIHIDIKKLGKFERQGHRITGDRKGQSNPRGRKQGGYGWEYLHVAIDDHSRLAYAQVMPDEKGDTSLIFAKNTIQFFKQHGIKTQRIMTDNGVGYKKQYANNLKSWGVKHITTKPYTPKTNGKAERFIQTCLREWAYATPFENSTQRQKQLTPFIDFYNNQRYHHAIKQTPISKCQQPIKI